MNPLDIRVHLAHRLSVALNTSVYCRTCDYYLDETHTIALELDGDKGTAEVAVLTPLRIGEGR